MALPKTNKLILFTIGFLLLCGAGFFWTYGSHLGQWMADKQSYAIDQASEEEEDKPDPRYDALDNSSILTLIPGVSAQGNDYYAGLPQWQQPQDVLNHPAREGRSRIYSLRRYANETGDLLTALLVFRADTLGQNSTQMLGLQQLRYDNQSRTWQADGKPVLTVATEPGGKLDFKPWHNYDKATIFRFEVSHPTQAGYRRSETGVLAWLGSELHLVLHYQSAFEPEDGSCSVGDNTPCRKVLNQFAESDESGDDSTAGWPRLVLESNEVNQHDNQTRKFKLKFDPKRVQYLLDDGRPPGDVNTLSITHGDTFLASLANPTTASATAATPDPIASSPMSNGEQQQNMSKH